MPSRRLPDARIGRPINDSKQIDDDGLVSARLKGRQRLVKKLVADLADWTQGQGELEGIVLVGSYARGTAGMASDVDVVIITARFEELARNPEWFLHLRPGSKLIRTKTWGQLLERRFRLRSGLQVELGLVSPSWAALPLDDGTMRVLADGHRIIYERGRLLTNASEAVRKSRVR